MFNKENKCINTHAMLDRHGRCTTAIQIDAECFPELEILKQEHLNAMTTKDFMQSITKNIDDEYKSIKLGHQIKQQLDIKKKTGN